MHNFATFFIGGVGLWLGIDSTFHGFVWQGTLCASISLCIFSYAVYTIFNPNAPVMIMEKIKSLIIKRGTKVK